MLSRKNNNYVSSARQAFNVIKAIFETHIQGQRNARECFIDSVNIKLYILLFKIDLKNQ